MTGSFTGREVSGPAAYTERMRRPIVLMSLVLFAAAGCRPDTVPLSYRFPERGILRYTMRAVAEARWDIGGPGAGSYRVTFDVVEATLESTDTDRLVRVTMSPTSVEEEGLPSPGPEDRTFTLRIDDSGQVGEVVEVDGVSAEALDPDELAFIGTYRPPLPDQPVRLGDRWSATQLLDAGTTSQRLATTGELVALRVDGRSRLSDLAYSGGGPLTWTTPMPQGTADLTGTATTSGTALIDIGAGFLRQATSSTRGTFEVRIEPAAGTAPVTGTLDLDLTLDLHLVERTTAEQLAQT